MINLWRGMQYLIGKYMSATLDKNPFKILSRTWGKASAKQDILSTTLVLTDMERVFVYDGLMHCFYFSWRSKSHHRKLLFSKFCALHCSLLDKETKWFYGCCFIHDIASVQVFEGTGISWYMEETLWAVYILLSSFSTRIRPGSCASNYKLIIVFHIDLRTGHYSTVYWRL